MQNIFKFLLIFTTLLNIDAVYSQDWNSLDDSAYNQIVTSRFNKGNYLFGFGIEMPEISNGFKDYRITVQPQFGYFFAGKWMLGADFNIMLSNIYVDSINTVVTYNHYLFETTVRYYFNQRCRTFFVEAGPLMGNVNLYDEKNYYAPHLGLVYGGKGAAGFSIFIRRFEFQFIVGYLFYSDDYKKGNIAVGSFLQLNLSRITSKTIFK